MSLFCFQTGASLQQKADGWKEKVNDTRGSRPRTPTHVDQDAQVQTHHVVSSIILIQREDYTQSISTSCVVLKRP